MNLEAFCKQDDGFAIQGFRAQFRWKTRASISFMLCHPPAANVRKGFGWLDVHETDDEWRRIKIRVCLHHDYLRFEDCQEVVEEICSHLSLPNDSYEATFISPLKQISCMTRCDHEFVSYGPPCEPGDNPWDDRDGVSPLEIISREEAFGMLLAAFPEFHRRVDSVKRLEVMRDLGDPFLDFRETVALADAVESAISNNEHAQLRRLFDVLEKLAVYGDEYTRNASLTRLFELLQQRESVAGKLEPFLLPETLVKWTTIAEEMEKWGDK